MSTDLADPAAWDYAPAPESRAIGHLKDRYLPFVDGAFVEGGGPDLESIEPGTGQRLAAVSTVDAAGIDHAVAVARRAQTEVWGRMRGAERGTYLFRIARGIAERARELAVVETLDNGKPIRESRDFDVPAAAQHFFSHAGWADKLQHLGLGRSPQPLGVAGQVIPWNFPLLMAAWKIAPALAAGNTVVIKPAETTSLSILVLAEIIADAGLPPGVVNIVPGAGDVGATLLAHPGLDKVAFTGSTSVGRGIARSLAGTGRRVTLELGGKGANIVFDDAALDQAVEGVVDGIFFNQGQVCCAGSRLLLQEPIAEEFLVRLKRRVATLRVGDPMDKNTDVGAVNSATQLERIQTLLAAGEAEGAQSWTAPGSLPAGGGYYVAPTIFTAATASMRVAREEIFGPVLTTMTFRTPDEAVAKANNTPYGLSAGVWTEKGSRAMAMAAALRAGTVWDNSFNRFDPTASFGGYGESGYGREGGPSGMAAYLQADEGDGPMSEAGPTSRPAVTKTYKLYVGGAFPRSESGRTYPVHTADGSFWANAAQASRKDARDAVTAARAGSRTWSRATPYLRGQVIYRVAEMLEGRRAQFVELLGLGSGADAATAGAEVDAAVDRLVHYAGWTDKLAAVLGSANAVSGPYFSYSAPEPMGVVAVLAPAGAPLLGLVSVVAPVMATANATVVLVPEADACTAITFAEVLATSDVPAGVVNLLTGRPAELAPHLAAHGDVAALDLTGADAALRTELENAAAETLKRVYAPAADVDLAADPGLARLRAFSEIKTVWHPTGALSLAAGGSY